ncbi:sulfur carrier protein ThiS [Xylophilus sp. Kf1]|nr:sulfur carrier protein ThiS [Xylophilus sp. Kf1]
MPIEVGGRPRTVPAGSDLAQLVAALGHAQDAVATGVNGDFVRRDLRCATRLAAGDRVLIFQPIVGG